MNIFWYQNRNKYQNYILKLSFYIFDIIIIFSRSIYFYTNQVFLPDILKLKDK